MNTPRVAVICDLLEEKWPSMDLVAEMLFKELQQNHRDVIAATHVRLPLRRRLTRLAPTSKHLFNADRLINRFRDYPRWMRSHREEFDLFHVIDHSYAQLLHELPPERTIVTCHDLDTFRCLLEPEREPRSKMFRAMTRRVLDGFRTAARVTCDSIATRDELLAHKLLPPERVRVVYNGVSSAFSTQPDAAADREAQRLLGASPTDAIDILHVGSTIPRKRIDVLLRIFAALRRRIPQARLVRAGGAFTRDQLKLLEKLGLEQAVVILPHLSDDVLAAVYRRAALLMQPSEREGFGLPVVEAMACGAVVVASELPVLREVGGEAAIYCPVADVEAWTEAAVELLRERDEEPERWASRRQAGLAQSALFSWAEYARRMVALYQELISA